MNTAPDFAGLRYDVSLNRQALFKLPDAAGLDISCASGTVWITLDDDPRDYVLQAPHTFTTPEHRRAIIYAMEPSRVAIAQAPRSSGA